MEWNCFQINFIETLAQPNRQINFKPRFKILCSRITTTSLKIQKCTSTCEVEPSKTLAKCSIHKNVTWLEATTKWRNKVLLSGGQHLSNFFSNWKNFWMNLQVFSWEYCFFQKSLTGFQDLLFLFFLRLWWGRWWRRTPFTISCHFLVSHLKQLEWRLLKLTHSLLDLLGIHAILVG